MRSVVVLFSFALAACASSRLPLYGSDSCGVGLTGYVDTSRGSAVCLPEENVAYILCVREISLGSSTRESTRGGSGDLGIGYGDIKIGGSAEVHFHEQSGQTWASDPAIAAARADAINSCKELLPSPAKREELMDWRRRQSCIDSVADLPKQKVSELVTGTVDNICGSQPQTSPAQTGEPPRPAQPSQAPIVPNN
jgi:hypothetical protein